MLLNGSHLQSRSKSPSEWSQGPVAGAGQGINAVSSSKAGARQGTTAIVREAGAGQGTSVVSSPNGTGGPVRAERLLVATMSLAPGSEPSSEKTSQSSTKGSGRKGICAHARREKATIGRKGIWARGSHHVGWEAHTGRGAHIGPQTGERNTQGFPMGSHT